MQLSHLLAFALSLAASEAAHKGFDYGANKADGSVKVQADFQSEFQTAKNLVGTSGFNSARLYTMIQGGSTNDPIAAIPAAIAEETSLLLGLWASGGGMDNEIAALKAAISKYGEEFTKLVVGISVGSEDLYRNSYDGVQANAGVGINPDELANYIKEVRSAIAGTSLSGASIGHVDTWTAWVNGSNSAVVDACDWLGFDGYPYFQNTMANSIEDAKSLFHEAVDKTKSVSNGKEVWITETGWPVSGDKQNLAVASKENAKTFWDEVGCPLFDTVNTWWYILQDAGSVTPNPSFGVVGSDLSTTPLFDLSCKGKSSSSSSSAAPSGTSAASSSQASGGASGSASSSGSSSSSGSGSSSSSGAGAGAGASSTSSSSRTPHITGGPLGSRPSGNAGKGASSTLIPSSSSVASSSIVVSSGAPSKTGTSSSGAGAGSSGSNSGSGSGSYSSSSAGAGASPSESSLLSNNASTMSGSILSVAVFIFALVIAV